MGGLLQAYGQSTAPATFNDVVKNMAGVARAGYEVEQNRQEMGLREKGLGLQEAYLNIAKAEEDRKAKDFAEKQAQQEKFYPTAFFFGNEPTAAQQEVIKIAMESKLGEDVGGVVGMRAKNFKPFMELLNSRPQLSARLSQIEIGDLNNQIAEARSQLNTMPDDDKKVQAQQNLMGLLQRLQVQTDAYTNIVKSSPGFMEKSLLLEGKGSNVKGFNPGTKRPVVEDAKGNLWEDGKPYQGGPLQPITHTEPTSLDPRWLANWRMDNPNATPAQENAAIEKHQKDTGAIRGESFAHSRPVNVLDTKNGNVPTIMSLADMQAGNAAEPGRYIATTGGTKALGQTALIEDIRGAITNTRNSLKGLKTDFTATQAAQIAMVLKQRDPRSATSAFIGSQVGQTLTPEQVDYVTDLAQLIENGMAMRSVLGAGQGSDELRSAIMATIPSAKTPNRGYAYKQLDKFEQQINRLSAGVPKVPLRQDVGQTQTMQTGAPTVIEQRRAKDGRILEKLSDGTIREAQ